MSTPVKLGYRIFRFQGAGEALNFPVVLLRGLGRSSGFWLEFSEKLSEHAEVICLDLLGTGLSRSRWGRGSIAAFADDVIHTLNELGYQKVFFVGISMGGMVALDVATRSQLVARLAVLASSSRGNESRRIRPRALAQLLWSLRKGTPSNKELAEFLVSSKTLSQRPELPSVWDQLWRQEGFSTLPVLRQLLAAAVFDGRPALKKLNVPTLFMVSKDDNLVPWRNTVQMWEKAKDCRLVVLEGYGHDFPTEAPDEVISHLVSHFSASP
ncbi:alpha/beta hydrolase [bacterium]|nr:alpha/beta hydrolase [bacterium]